MPWPLGSLYEKWSFFLDSDIVPDIFDESKPHKCHFGYDPKTCTCACCTAARKVAYAKRLLAEEEAVNLGFSKNIQRDGATFGSMSAPEPPPPPQESPREKQDRQRRERYKESEKAWAQVQANEAERKAKKQPPTYGNDPDFIKGYVEHSENKDLSGMLSITPQGQALTGVASGIDAIKAGLAEFNETGSIVGATKVVGSVALESYAERKIKLPNGARKYFDKEIEWQATREKGTKNKYKVVQRNDIDWGQIRTSGDKRYIGKTNLEAANKGGLSPQLPDGSYATLHHLGQKNTGPLVEASTRYHGVGKSGQDALHSQYGRSKPHPTLQPDRKKFAVDDREYWKVRDK